MVVDTLHAIIVFGGTYLAKLDRCGHPAVRSYLLLRGRFNRMARYCVAIRKKAIHLTPYRLKSFVLCSWPSRAELANPPFSFKVGPTVTLGADCCVPCG